MWKGFAISALSALVMPGLTAGPQQQRGIGPATNQAISRVALVIGNGNYGPTHSLKNPPNDARDVAEALRGLQFDVDLVVDGSWETMGRAVDRFVAKLGPGIVGLFYFSGHGAEVGEVDYLISTDFTGGDPAEAKYKSIAANAVQERMESRGSRLNILVLDACRDTPVDWGTRGTSGGLGPIPFEVPGTVILFATKPKQTASDNPNGKNGLFTKYLLEGLQLPNLDILALFNYVGDNVYRESGEKQLPVVTSTPLHPFVINETVAGPVLRPLSVDDLTAEPAEVARGGTVRLTARTGYGGGRLHYQWSSPGGAIEANESTAQLRTQAAPGRGPDAIEVTVTVTDDSGRTASRSVRIRIVDPAPVVTFTVDRPRIEDGESATLRWIVTGAESVRLDPGIGDVPLSGARTLTPKGSDYILTAVGPGGTVTRSVQIAVLPNIADFDAAPATIRQCDQAFLRWTIKGATSARIEPGVGEVKPTDGYRMVMPRSSTVYKLIAHGKGGDSERQFRVNVTPAAGACGAK